MSVAPPRRLVGLNVDLAGVAHVPTVQRSGVNAVRLVLCQWDAHAGRPVDVGAVVARYATQGLAVLGVFARESLADEQGRERSWERALGDYAELVGLVLWGVQLGNEYSNPPNGASWAMTTADQAVLIALGAAAFLTVNPEIAIVSGQVGTGRPQDLAALDLGQVTHCGVGLYNESVGGWPPDAFGSAEMLLTGFRDAAGGLPLIVSEWSTTNDDQADRYIPMSAAYYRSLPFVAGDFYFRYRDGGDDQHMGLFDAQGQPTVRWEPFCRANQQEGPMPDQTLPDNGALAWGQRWTSLTADAAYHHEFGIESTWRKNADAWGYPLAEAEQDFAYNGGTAKGRVFSKIGLVIWDPAKGAQVIGWP